MKSRSGLPIVQAPVVPPLVDLSIASAPAVIVEYDDHGRFLWATCGRDDGTLRAALATTRQRAA